MPCLKTAENSNSHVALQLLQNVHIFLGNLSGILRLWARRGRAFLHSISEGVTFPEGTYDGLGTLCFDLRVIRFCFGSASSSSISCFMSERRQYYNHDNLGPHF